jgi:hypothetical protein
MRRAILCAAVILAACTGPIEPDEKTGFEAALGQSGTAFAADLSSFKNGPVPWLGASGVSVQDGAVTLGATASIGQLILPYSMKPRTSEGGGFDSTITVEAEVPFGSQLIVGRGRLRDSLNQAGVGVIVAPSSSSGTPTSFLIGLGLGTFAGAPVSLACGGTPLGQSTLLIPTPAGTSAVTGITSMDLGRQTIALPSAPQLALLANDITGGHGTASLAATRQTLTFKFKKGGDGVGSVSATQDERELFATQNLDAAAIEGRSLACKLSWATCEAICANPLNALFVFGRACTENACRDGATTLTESAINPDPGDFSGSETCRQNTNCNTAPAPSSQVSLTAKTAVREVFRNDAASNEILFQLVRARSGQAPRIFRIQVDR